MRQWIDRLDFRVRVMLAILVALTTIAVIVQTWWRLIAATTGGWAKRPVSSRLGTGAPNKLKQLTWLDIRSGRSALEIFLICGPRATHSSVQSIDYVAGGAVLASQ